ncbi:MAG TPA: GNAT family N-acetyltransferase [Pseudoxanthomonas sp.]
MKYTSSIEGVGSGLPTLVTSRFQLRPLAYRDEDFYVSVYTDEALMRFVGQPMTPTSAADAFRAFLKSNARGDLRRACCWMIEQPGDDAAIGLLALIPHSDAAEIGVMVSGAWQGRKVAQETIGFLSAFLLRHSDWTRTFSRHVRDNEAGAGVMRRLGFSEMRDVPGGIAFRGWEMTRAAWRERDGIAGQEVA